MHRDNLIHNESLLHWVWSTLHFNTRNLQTRSGAGVQIIDPGHLNYSDGPDFLSAQLFINGLFWYGNIEMHLNEQDWYHHQHHRDPAYNGVVLHVVLNDNARRTIRRKDGTMPFTLTLKPYISNNLLRYIRNYKAGSTSKTLPCSQHSDEMLRDDLFLRQLSRAHKAYFYQKVYDQYQYWDPLPPWRSAWKKMVTLSLFDGLGITQNRESMVRLARTLYQRNLTGLSKQSLQKRAARIAGLDGYKPAQNVLNNKNKICFNWNQKGVRPNNRPLTRIKQGITLLKKIQKASMQSILEDPPRKIWDGWTSKPDIPGLGSRRSNILYGISLLPCLKIAADLNGNRNRGRQIRHAWNLHRVEIPKTYTRILDKTLLNKDIYSRCLGSVYQLRHYCLKHRCTECLVFKKAFSS